MKSKEDILFDRLRIALYRRRIVFTKTGGMLVCMFQARRLMHGPVECYDGCPALEFFNVVRISVARMKSLRPFIVRVPDMPDGEFAKLCRDTLSDLANRVFYSMHDKCCADNLALAAREYLSEFELLEAARKAIPGLDEVFVDDPENAEELEMWMDLHGV